MPPPPLKFRCDRCGQLLGVSPSRAGRPVKCPKCGAGLTVPASAGPIESPGATAMEAGANPDAPWTAIPSGTATGSPGIFDIIDLEPDDLRSLFPDESGEAPAAEGPPPPRDQLPEPAPPPSLPLDFPEPPVRPPGPTAPSVMLPIDTEPVGDEPAGRGSARSAPVLPEPILGPGPAPRARAGRDVVVPRVAFVAWSLFVLFALFASFVAGLLAGRYVWTGPA